MKDIATKPATCTKGKTVTMRCKYCSYQFTTTVGSPMGHSMTYSYDAKTKKIIGKCSRGDVYDKNVTYEDYLYFEQSKDGKANREKYADLFLLNNPKIGKSVGQLRSEINKFNITEESYKTIMKELTGLPENYLPSLNPTNGSFVDVFTQLNAYQAVYQNFKAVDYYEWAQFGYSLLRILGGDGDVNDYMTTMGKLVSCVDKFNIMSTQLEVIQKEIGEMSKKVQEYRNKMFSYIAWDTPIEACDDKLVAEMTLKELVDYEYQIRASFSRLDGGPKANENAQAAYNYIVSLKKLYIYYLILNPEEMSFEEFRDLNDRVYEIYNDILKNLF